MVVEMETLASSMTEGKMARDCDACTKGSRANWYCPADDAFLCQICDASIHSANQLAKRHERVRLQSSTLSPDKTTSVWYEGFTRKARTPRNKGGLGLEKLSHVESNDPLVPELGGEEVQEQDGLFSFSSTDENEESLNYLVPVFDPFSDMVNDDGSSFDLFPDGVDIDADGKELGDDDGLIGGFLPMDMDLAELTMDVESLLKEEQPNLEVKVEGDLGFEINRKALESVKDEVVEVEQKCEIEDEVEKKSFLKLDFESVVTAWGSHGSPWKNGTKPELNSWPEVQLRGYTCPTNMVGWETHQQRRSRGGSDGDREARVLRYKEKRRTRLFAKKIRYEVRKLNAEQRPRIKGRFVKRSSL